MRKSEDIRELEYKIDFMCARLLCIEPEKQERAKEQIREYFKEYFELTGKCYIPWIQRKKYEMGEY